MYSNTKNSLGVIELLGRGQYEKVLRLLANRSDWTGIPEGRFWEIRGLAHYALGEIPAAINAFETANTLVTLSLVAQVSLARCYLRQRFPLAAEAILSHLTTQPLTFENEILCTGVAEGLSQLDMMPETISVCRRSLSRFPQSHRLNFLCGMALRKETCPPGHARKYLQRAFRARPKSILYATELAKECLDAGALDETARVLSEFDPSQLTCVAALQRLKLIYEQLGDEGMEQACSDRLREMYYQVQSRFQ